VLAAGAIRADSLSHRVADLLAIQTGRHCRGWGV